MGGGFGGGFAFCLEAAEFGEVEGVAAIEARLLQLEVAELLFVAEMDFEVDEGDALGWREVRVHFGGFVAAAGVDRRFERGDAGETPLGVGKGLNEFGFAGRGGSVFFGIGGEVLAVGVGVVGGEEDGAAGQSSFDGVHGGDAFAFERAGTGGELGVLEVGGMVGGRDGERGGMVGVRFPVEDVGGEGRGLVQGRSKLGRCVAQGFAGLFFGTALGGAADGSWAHDGQTPLKREWPGVSGAPGLPERSMRWAENGSSVEFGLRLVVGGVSVSDILLGGDPGWELAGTGV